MFSKKEEAYLKGNLQINRNYDRVLRKRINRKIRTFINHTLPLLSNNSHTGHWIMELKRILNDKGTENNTIDTEFNTPNTLMVEGKTISYHNERALGVGFEPTKPRRGYGLASRRRRPLGYPSIRLSTPLPSQLNIIVSDKHT